MAPLRKGWLLVVVVVMALVITSGSMASQRELVADGGNMAYLPLLGESGPNQLTVVYNVSEAEQQKALEYWTYEQRLAAQPLPMPTVSEADMALELANVEPAGTPGRASSGAPDPDADVIAEAAFADEWERLAKDELDAAVEALAAQEDEGGDITYGSRGVFTSYGTNVYGQTWKFFPFRAVGKLFISGGGTCSASVISPNNVIVTAAHCVYNRSTGSFYPGWAFAPAYRNGVAPYGVWSGASASVLTNYITTGGMRYDVAVIKLNTLLIDGFQRPVSYLTGNLGRSWNIPYTTHVFAQGYPANLAGAQYLWTCVGETFPLATDILGVGCNMTGGSSGGPWIRTFYPYAVGANNFVSGVVSGLPASEASQMGWTFFGPRFSDSNIVILCNAQGC